MRGSVGGTVTGASWDRATERLATFLVVRHALEVRGDAQAADDEAQVGGDGLAQREQADDLGVDLALQRVDPAVALHRLLGEVGVAARERLHRGADLRLDHAAHAHQRVVQLAQLLVVGLDDVRRHWMRLLPRVSRSGR